MMIKRDVDNIMSILCDNCGGDFGIDQEGFSTTIASAKEGGWKVRKEGERWEHYCPECCDG